jgi:hypothetical protein
MIPPGSAPAGIPMVFAMGGDSLNLGIVDGLGQPGCNVTGMSFLVSEMAANTFNC